MSKKKEEQKAEEAPQVESEYFFPEYGKTVKARDKHEALEKVKQLNKDEEGVKE